MHHNATSRHPWLMRLPAALTAIFLVVASVFSWGFSARLAQASFATIEITDSSGNAITSFIPGALLYITVTDANRNTNASAIEQVDVTVTTTVAVDSEALTTSATALKETGANTGIYRNTGLPTAFKDGTVTQNDGTLEVDVADSIKATYTDPTGETILFDFANSPQPHSARETAHVDDGVNSDDPSTSSCADSAVYTGAEGSFDPNTATNGGYIPTDNTKHDFQPGSKTTNGGVTVSNISSDNDVRESNKTISENVACHGWNIHEFTMKVSPFVGSTLSSLDIQWRGAATSAGAIETAAENDAFLLVYNRTANIWETRDTEANIVQSDAGAFTDIPLSATISTNFADYIDATGNLRLAVIEYSVVADGIGGGLYTDYISVSANGQDSVSDTLAVGGGSIFGTVWNDKDRDGIFDSSEPGLVNVSVTLLDDTGTALVTDKTDANGDYGFIGFPADTYSLRETDPSGFVSTTSNTRGPLTLASGQVIVNQDFGDAQQLSTTGLQQRYVVGSTAVVLSVIGLTTLLVSHRRRSLSTTR